MIQFNQNDRFAVMQNMNKHKHVFKKSERNFH